MHLGAMETVAGLVKCMEGKDDLVVGTIFRWAIKPLLLKGEPLETLVSGVRVIISRCYSH